MSSAPLTDALAQKAAKLERCVARVREERTAAGAAFATDHSRQDAAILNIQRGCEQAIDMANMVVAARGWGLPETAREAFDLLKAHGAIDTDLASALARMVGFRNVAVHQYDALDLAIVERVIEHGLNELLTFADRMLAFTAS